MTINFNTEPYYDDFDEGKKFYRILYRPGYAVQARELTQMQTILQNQVSRFGDNIFKEGAMVIPGQISMDNKIGYVKLEPIYGSVLADTVVANFVGKVVTNTTTGLKAEVLHYTKSSGSEPAALFVRYINSATSDNTSKVFADGQILQDADGNYFVQTVASAATGVGSICTIEQGVYYIKGHFVLVEKQTIILDKFSDTPSYRVGLVSTESVITAEEDVSLFDNAQNSFNYAAPGAHRYAIDSVLTKLELTSTQDTDFIELLRVANGVTQKQVNSTQYAVIEDTMARRTYDESGNYTVRPFEIDIREHRNNNRGVWAGSTAYLLGDVVTNGGVTYVAKNSGTSVAGTGPIHTTGTVIDGLNGVQWEYNTQPYYNRGIFSPADGGDESKLAVGLEPGKAYVQGYEIEKIATEYVPVNKARDFVSVDNAVIPATVGNYVIVTNINGLPPIDTLGVVTMYNYMTSTVGTAPAGATAVGTARVRGIEWHNGTIGTQTAQYKLFLFDVKMNSTAYSFQETVKSFFFNVSSDPQLSFTADVQPILGRVVGSATAAGTTTITGTGTSFQTDFEVNDYIVLGGTTLRRITAIASQTSLTVDTSVTVTGVTIDEATTNIAEPENTSLVFSLPYYAIKSVRSSSGTNDTTYTVANKFAGTAGSASGGTCVLTINISNALVATSGTFASAADSDNYIVVDADATAGGAIVAPTGIVPNGTSVDFTLPSAYAGRNFVVIAAINKSNTTLTEKTKTLTVATPVTFTTQATATVNELLLGKADGFRLISVKMKSGTFASPGSTYSIDVTDRYDFDNGQRATHYDVARLLLKNSYAPPSAPIQVEFEYFLHSPGDYFTVNSYPSNVDYKQIPYYADVALRDSFDFRPRINDDGTTFSTSGVSLLPKRGIDIRTDFSYYLARNTKIAVDFGGNFFKIDGVSSINPGDPLDPSLGMVLYTLALEPYTFSTSNNSVKVNKVDNKRYTMRDIGKLEKRIDNLEYYTSLSLLEQQTESLNITDSNGLDRFKNGFIVDGFTGHNTGDVTNPDYICAIDMERAELRPFYSMNNINLIEKNSNNTQRAAGNYKLYGDVITLPVLEHKAIVTQQYASRLENINPFAVFTFLGNISINPSSDDWFEVDRRPDLIVDVMGNFNTIKSIADKAGILGTVWNAWQTQWTGAPITTGSTTYTSGDNWAQQRAINQGATVISIADMQATFGGAARNAPARQVTVQTSATQIGQSRTGVKTNLVSKIDMQVVGDRILSTATIPYIRSRNVLVQVKGLKPSTRFYPFFDGIDVSSYCTPSTKITYTPSGATAAAKLITHNLFDDSTNVGGLASQTSRRINGDSQVCLNKGDVITGGSSGATAVIVGKEYNSEAGTYVLNVSNVIGTFSANETITGSISTAQGTFVSATNGSAGANLVTNFAGEINLLFKIPNTEALRFRTGNREFKLVDVSTANGDYSSRARTNYRAEGVLETRQQTVNAVRNAELVEEVLQGNRVIVQTSQRVVADTGWYDPLAQTFLVDSKGGAFLSKVDIFFSSKDSAIPVTLEIREVVNGYPGKLVLPFSRVTLKPEQVNISGNTVTLNDAQVPSYDVATTFTFPSPVYVQDGAEYAIVLASDSNKYKVWISQVGDTIPGTPSRTISEQPYNGVLFKSQNASTWTADQTQDLKFTLYRAKFDTSVVSNVQFVNDVIPLHTLDLDPFEIRSGSTTVRVWHRDHGMPSGSSVTISGVASALNGIPTSELNKTHTISNADLDSYTIPVTTSPTSSGYAGGSVVKATKNIQFDSVQPTIQVQSFSETPVAFGLKTTSGKSVDSSSQTAYIADSGFSGVLANENNVFSSPRMVSSEVNEVALLSGNKSVTMSVVMSTTNDALSPIIDTHRTSLIAIGNKVNSPTEATTNVSGVDDNTLLSANNTVAFSGSTMTSANSTTQGIFSTVSVGKYLTISGATNAANNGTFLVTAVATGGTSITMTNAFTTETAGASVTVKQRQLFVSEIAPSDSSTYSKYVTKRVNLANGSDYLRIKFAGNIPDGSSVEVYYKTATVGSTTSFDKVNYTLLSPDTAIINNNSFNDISYSASNLPTFDAVQLKIVMKSTNSSAVPRIKDLRVIACV